jgi:hypothetical protein
MSELVVTNQSRAGGVLEMANHAALISLYYIHLL